MKRAAGFVIFRQLPSKTIEYLLLQASYGEHHWSPPKGHVDPGETEMETAIRETQEEAGYTSSDLKIYENSSKQLHYCVKGKPKEVHYWLAKLISDKTVTLSNEHQDSKWLIIEEAMRYACYTDMQQLLKYFDNYISENDV